MTNPHHQKPHAAPGAMAGFPHPVYAAEDDELFKLLAAYSAVELAMDGPLHGYENTPDFGGLLLRQILDYQPRTIIGALAKLRFGFDEMECRENLGDAARCGPSLDGVGYAAILDIYRLMPFGLAAAPAHPAG